MKLKDFLKHNGLVLALYLLLLALAGYFILNYEKNSIHIFLNQFVGNKYLNIFFYYITYAGDGLFGVFLLLLLLFFNVRLGIFAILSFLSATVVSTALKYIFFDDANRPHFIFQQTDHALKVVEGVHLHIHNSFPSGHATQAFAILMCLIFTARSPGLKLIFFLIALATSLSRVYLSQHWLVDITAGSLIGTACSLLFYYLIFGRNRFLKLNKPLTALKKD